MASCAHAETKNEKRKRNLPQLFPPLASCAIDEYESTKNDGQSEYLTEFSAPNSAPDPAHSAPDSAPDSAPNSAPDPAPNPGPDLIFRKVLC